MTSRRYTNGLICRCLQVCTSETQNGGAMGGGFTSREQPVLPAQHDRSERLLRAVVVDLEPAVFGVARQRDPVAQRVTDGRPEPY